MNLISFKAYRYLFVSAPVICAIGAVTIIVGAILQQHRVMQIGTGLFLTGISVLLFSKGAGILIVTVVAMQVCGFKVIKERILYSVAWFFGALVLMFLGGGLFCMVVRGYFLAK